MNGPTPAELVHAEVAGRWARQGGREEKTCPTWAIGELGAPWRDRWHKGWREGNQPIKGEGK